MATLDAIHVECTNVLVELMWSPCDSWRWRWRIHLRKDLEEIRYFGWRHISRVGNVTIVVTKIRRFGSVRGCVGSTCVSGSIETMFDFRVNK